MTAGMDRDEILRRFEALLDSAMAAEEPPSGIDAEILASVTADGPDDEARRCDSYALWTAMTALTQEIKLQGRAFQELNHSLASHSDKTTEELRTLYAERERTVQREAEKRSRREALRSLIDLRDRLTRGLVSVQARQKEMSMAPKPGRWARLFGKPTSDLQTDAVGALVRGYELGIERLDQTLDEFNARVIRCQGESFDPRTMNAIESQESAEVPDGTVLEVYLSGYEWSGEVFRPAQVKVSRSPASRI